MPKFQENLKHMIRRSAGQIFWRKITVTSSHIKTATKLALSAAATGELAILQVVMKTDATGIAGGTNLVLSSTNAKGVANIAVETVANLGANVTKSYGNPPAGDTTTSDGGFTVTSLITVLEAGCNLQINSSVADCTGSGTVDIYVKFERIAENADLLMTGTAV